MSEIKSFYRRPVIFDLTSELCVWSAAGVVPPRRCHRAFNCIGCEYDQVVQKRLAQGRALSKAGGLESWRTRLNREPYERRQCRHMLSGSVSVMYCDNEYDCAHCEYDQMLDEQQLNLKPEEPEVDVVAGVAVPERYYFHRGHVWARMEYGGRVRVGLDDFAWRLLGRPDGLEVPRLGGAVVQGDPAIELQRDEHVARAVSPVDGVVVAVNPLIQEQVEVAHDTPFGRSWLMLVEPTRLTPNLRHLLFGPAVASWLEDEAARLAALVTPETEYRLAATGGRMVDDVYGTVPGLDWDELVHQFLRT